MDLLPVKQYMQVACGLGRARIETESCLPGTEELEFGSAPVVENVRPSGPDSPDPLKELYGRIYQPLVPQLPQAQIKSEDTSEKPAYRADQFYSKFVGQMKRLLQRPTQAYLKSQCLKSGEKLRQDLLTSVVPEASDEGYSYELPEEEENDEEEEYVDPFKLQSAGLNDAELASAYA